MLLQMSNVKEEETYDQGKRKLMDILNKMYRNQNKKAAQVMKKRKRIQQKPGLKTQRYRPQIDFSLFNSNNMPSRVNLVATGHSSRIMELS